MGLKYIVVENDPGYLPDSEPEEYDTREDAVQRLKDIREEWLELGWNPFEIRGSAEEGWYTYGHSGRVAEIMEVMA